MKKSKYIDHTLLKPIATKDDIKKLCEEAIEYDFYSVCVNPYYVEYAAGLLKGTDVKVACVIGFPLGANTTAIKKLEAVEAVNSGANCAFFLNPTRVEQIAAVGSAGQKMPQKSTYFYPKLITGLVMNKIK